MPLELVDDHMCYVCGKENKHGLRLDFDHSEPGKLRATVVFEKHHQGFKNIVHGGMVAMVLDEMMVNLAWKEGIPAVTAELKIRLKKPCPVGEKVFLEGALKGGEGRLLRAEALAKDAKGEILATGKAVCVRISATAPKP